MNLTNIMNSRLFLLLLVLVVHSKLTGQEKSGDFIWSSEFDFDGGSFRNPNQEFSPFARWWWPGDDVNLNELKHEIGLFTENGFGGVEIQILTPSLPSTLAKVRATRGWDTPEYYHHVRSVLGEAKRKGLIIDMTNGSGWPPGGSYIEPKDGILTLVQANIDIKGGAEVSVKIPEATNPTGVTPKLIAVLASRIVHNKEQISSNPIALEPLSTIVLTDRVKNDSLIWRFPAGDWKLIAFWSRPQSHMGTMVAAPKQGPVMNHFDSIKVFENYEYLFGERTGLPQYYGNPLRAVFNDSYEFEVDRFFSSDFVEYFKERRGYDIIPWLPVNMQEKRNYASYKNPNSPPDFYYSSQDWRLRYDYDQTVGELFGEHFIRASSNWLEKRGMLHRNQGYGIPLDVIAGAGLASIPECEGDSELELKTISSGAHLYNRPIMSAEVGTIKSRAYMTTPQKLKLIVDKFFLAGINQIVYHGIPYRYINDETTEVGWHPFNLGFIDFASHLGESTQFWKYQKDINKYVTRMQYVLRSGKPHTDVLIYYPCIEKLSGSKNPEELIVSYLPDVEPPLNLESPEETLARYLPEFDPSKKEKESDMEKDSQSEKIKWTQQIYSVINQLEANGITWEWVNDESIESANLERDGQINIRGNCYQALMLVGVDILPLKTAKQINKLAKHGMKFMATGNLPSKQPSFLNWKENDKATSQLIKEACKGANSTHLQNNNELIKWIKGLDQTVNFNDKYHFVRQIERELSDGSRIQLIWNKSDKWQPISLTLDEKYKRAYWLNAQNGKITTTEESRKVNYVLPPYNTVILYASLEKEIDKELVEPSDPTIYDATKILTIDNWDLKVDTLLITDTTLFDWKNSEPLKHTSSIGTYSANFTIEKVDKEDNYLIDLGKVCFTADVVINGKPAGSAIYTPYTLNITNYIREGKNSIEIHVTPGQINGFIGEAENENSRYAKFKGRANCLMSSGLIGYVVIYKN